MSQAKCNYRKVLPKKIEFSEPLPGIVQQEITATQPGRVKWRGSFWPAKLYQPELDIWFRSSDILETKLSKNQDVSVIGREGITLLVAVSSPETSPFSYQSA